MPLPNTPLASLPIVVFDTETTGLYTMSAWMVEIAGVRTCGSMVTTGAFQTLVRPDAIIPPDATKVHGITDDEVRDAPPTADVLRAFFDWATTGAALKENGELFRTVDDILSDMGFVEDDNDSDSDFDDAVHIDGVILGDKHGRDYFVDDKSFDENSDDKHDMIVLDVPPLLPTERLPPDRLKKIHEEIERGQNPFFESEIDEPEPRWNAATPPGVPVDIPYVTPGDGEEFYGVFKHIDGIKRRIPGLRDFPELRGEKPAEKPKIHKPVIFAAHNSQYDIGILSTAFRRTGTKPPTDFVCIDTCAWARRVLPLDGFSLKKIIEYISSNDDIEIPFVDVEGDDCLGIDAAMFAMQGFHRALCDSFHTAVVLSHLLQVTKMETSGCTVDDLNRQFPGVVSYGIAEQRTSVELPLHLAKLNEAIEAQADVQIVYGGQYSREALRNGTGFNGEPLSPKALPRRIKPLGVYGAKGIAYLEAFCYIDGFVKTFRVDRIREVL